MIDLFLLKKALAALVLPPTGPLIVAFLGLAMLRRWPRLGRGLVAFFPGTLLAHRAIARPSHSLDVPDRQRSRLAQITAAGELNTNDTAGRPIS